MTRMKWALAAVAAVALAGGVQAQRQPGGQRQGQGGGMGGGQQQSLYVAAATNAELQKELKITDDQKSSMKEVVTKSEELTKKLQEMRGGGGGGGGGQEAIQKIQEERTKMNAEAKGIVEKALNADQKKRIKQIEVQAMGLAAFTNEEVLKSLKITDDQKGKVKEVTDESIKAIAALRTEYGIRGGGAGGGRGQGGGGGGGARPDPEKMAEGTKKIKEATDKTMEKVTAALTDDQKKMWKDMTGEAFDVAKLTQRPMRRDN